MNAPALPESRIYTFVDEARTFVLHFLEGQKLIQDLALIHPITGLGFAYFRKVVLTVQPLICLLKPGEHLGIYLDSSAPYFRLKLETSTGGNMRTMLLPEDFREFPETFTGLLRLNKFSPNQPTPYQSLVEAEGLTLNSLINRVLADSFQNQGSVLLGERSDQSALLLPLPEDPQQADSGEVPDVSEQLATLVPMLQTVMSQALLAPEAIVAALTEHGFQHLAGRTVRFRCECSLERMAQNIIMAYRNELDSLFDPGQEALAITCEYCKAQYAVTRSDLEEANQLFN